ncbi:unnamed protein product [Arctia plantaginis]|uniref:FP protein C-terminal domain-containing protein n=1 Tax=Arctia plantaginis TaxID=874455 RepID=A0A8S1ASS5_ARCPL|nr:unnamed protein product [Arctia plantaginis]
MANVQRTPTKNRQAPTNLHTQSEPDINSALLLSQNVNTSRHKRPRAEGSPQSSQSLNLQNLQETLSNWKSEQDAHISELLETQSTLITKLASDIGEIMNQNTHIKNSNAEISRQNTELVQTISFLNDKFEDMKKELEGLKKERSEHNMYIQNLEQKMHDLQCKSRSSSIEIRNIPQEEGETSTKLITAVSRIGEALGVPLPESALRDTYRLPGKSTGTSNTRPLIVEFSSVLLKQKVLSAVRSLNKNKDTVNNTLNTSVIGIGNERRPIYITEQLLPSQRKLFYQAREFAKRNDFKFCWITNGNIYLRKKEGDNHFLINSINRLHELTNKM